MSFGADVNCDLRTSSKTVDRRQVLSAVTVGISGLAGCSTRYTLGDSSEETLSESDSSKTAVHTEYDTTEVTIHSPDGNERGQVTAAIADTDELQYIGLSNTEMLPEDRGMLFPFEAERELSFVMRDMSFGIDIIYLDADRMITDIYHAPEPGPDEDGSEQSYPGRGKYVLEVNYNWTTDREVTTGDTATFDL